MDIESVIAHFGSQAALAAAIDVTPQMVSQWKKGKRPVSPESARAIDIATDGAIPRHALRPDVFGERPS